VSLKQQPRYSSRSLIRLGSRPAPVAALHQVTKLNWQARFGSRRPNQMACPPILQPPLKVCESSPSPPRTCRGCCKCTLQAALSPFHSTSCHPTFLLPSALVLKSPSQSRFAVSKQRETACLPSAAIREKTSWAKAVLCRVRLQTVPCRSTTGPRASRYPLRTFSSWFRWPRLARSRTMPALARPD